MPSDKAVVHVIDDDEAMRESLAFLLSAVGLEVRTYESALAFLEVAPNAEAGCVITDVRMPGSAVSICCGACASSSSAFR